MFYMMKKVLFYLKEGSVIINMILIIVYEGDMVLIDYFSMKGVIVFFM